MNTCVSCGQDFGSVSAFDAHRVGRHTQLFSHETPDGRRCLTASEMHARGFKRNSRGRWSLSVHVQPPDRAVDREPVPTYAGKDNS